ncbi:sterol desaturase family protein [Phenylobacterium sp.]|jgi:sterol desaturase/sphingolipid hydroxylase (fatty acid hydroxylase superfamily)|uniref:sterol desaturase family protein n=1 Tax=Phenylobacterium sp. TaxID=1871053 RepID=UPI002E37DCBA|nr:sterol desaturase family protein [Phenylobacterium sp.]HEX4709053.1 sterol desaturase family protein [Phenylobacterium sp.]
MASHLTEAVGRLTQPLVAVLGPLAVCALVFAGLAWLAKGPRALADARAAAGETKINAAMVAVDALAVGPLLAIGMAAVVGGLTTYGLQLDTARLWAWLGRWPTVAVAVVLGDFFGYWRHRAQHSRWLWPAHAVHHSDTRLTWFSLERMHPIDRAGSLLDMVLLSALGLPVWALAANALVRHYYGYFVHADLPWTLGKAGWVINSPVMHRWHHARDVEGSGHNFATVFSVWDRAFGTYYQPGPCAVPLGVREDMGDGALGQYAHPLKVWARALLRPRRVELSS